MPIKKIDKDLIEQINNSSLFKDANEKKYKEKKLVNTIVIKISDEHKKILENHFKNEKGLALSSGIRQIVFEYMKYNNLI